MLIRSCLCVVLAWLCLWPAAAGAARISSFEVCEVQNGPAWSGCQKQRTWEVDPQGRLIRLSAAVDLDRSERSPTAVFVSATASSAIYWDGRLIGLNGRPSRDPALEKAGFREAAIPVPPELATPGRHRLTLLMSSGLGPFRVAHPLIDVRVAPYEEPLQPVLRQYLLAIATAGALLLFCLFFSAAGWGRRGQQQDRMFGVAAFLGFLQLGVEASRGFIPYHYPIQIYRVSLILALAVAFAFALVIAVTRRFRPGLEIQTLLIQAAGASAAMMIGHGFDQKTSYVIMFGAALSALISGDGIRRRISFGWPMLGISVGCVATALLAPATFLDRDLYLWMLLLFGAVLVERVFHHGRAAGDTDHLSEGARENVDPNHETIPLGVGAAGSRHFLTPGEIIRLAAADDYTEVFVEGGRSFLHPEPLSKLMERLPGSFVRVHRSHAINLAHLRVFRSGRNSSVVLSDQSTAPVSRRRLQSLKLALGEH